MGILSRLFSKPGAESGHFIRDWAQRKMKDPRYASHMSVETMFVEFIYSVSLFGESGGAIGDPGEAFTCDSTLFEMAAYLWHPLDQWLSKNRPNLHREIAEDFARKVAELFAEALQIKNPDGLLLLFNERVARYEELGRRHADGDEYDHYLFQLMLRSKNNQKPEHYDVASDSFAPGRTWTAANWGLYKKLTGWNEQMVPKLLETMGMCIDAL